MTSFHYTREPPVDSTYKEIQSLNRFNSEQFEQICNLLLQTCIEPSKATKVLGELEDFSEQEGVSFNSLKAVFKSLLHVANSGLKLNLSAAQLEEDLKNLGLSAERCAHVSGAWSAQQGALSRAALSQTLMVNQLVDMEWKFGVTAASSDLNKVGNTFLQLKLLINKGNKLETTYMELSLNQFYSFLHEMEKAKSSLEYLS